MAKIDHNTINGLSEVQDRLNSLLDHVTIYRQSTVYKADYRFISNKIQKALIAMNEALGKVQS